MDKDEKLLQIGIEMGRIKTKFDELRNENKQLKEQLLVAETNAETFRLEMEDITKTLGLDENTLFDDVKVYARSLKENWNKLKEYIGAEWYCFDNESIEFEVSRDILDKMQKLEEGEK